MIRRAAKQSLSGRIALNNCEDERWKLLTTNGTVQKKMQQFLKSSITTKQMLYGNLPGTFTVSPQIGGYMFAGNQDGESGSTQAPSSI